MPSVASACCAVNVACPQACAKACEQILAEGAGERDDQLRATYAAVAQEYQEQFGTWLDVVLMEKPLGEGDASPPAAP